jgi:hypothetical protein
VAEKKVRKKREFKPRRPKKLVLDSRFYCCYANYIAQVYQCKSHSIRTDRQLKRDERSPFSHFITGDCLVVTSDLVNHHWIEGPYHEGKVLTGETTEKVTAMTWQEARALAVELHRAADVDRRFGVLEGANKNIVYANEAIQVIFEPDISVMMPFILYHPGWAKIFRDGRGVYRTFRHLSGAIEAADEEAAKLKG